MDDTPDWNDLDWIIRKIAEVQRAIDNHLKTGEEYRIESGASRRMTRKATLSEMMNYLDRLRVRRRELEGGAPVPVFVQAVPHF